MATIVIEHSDRTRSDRLGAVLRDQGHRLQVVQAHRGDPIPADLDNVDAVVTCGGPHSPDDDGLAWLGAELDLLRAAHEARLPVVGICLGCQLLARALGGDVTPLEDGIDCGWTEITLTPAGREDPLYAGQPWRSRQITWHSWHVEKPPDDARVLARSRRTPVEAWALGLRTYGFQYHPESYVETLEGWVADEPEALALVGLDRDALRRQTEELYPAFARLAQRMFEAMALVLMPLDRRYAGTARRSS